MTTFDALHSLILNRDWSLAWEKYTQEPSLIRRPPAMLLLAGAHAQWGMGRTIQALMLAQRALSALKRSEPRVYEGQVRFSLGVLAEVSGDTRIALEQLTVFLQNLPAYPTLSPLAGPAWYHIGSAHRMRHDLPKALEAYQQALETTPEGAKLRPGIALDLAWTHCDMLDADAADQVLQHACTDPPYADYIIGKAYVALVRKHHLDALDLCQQVFIRTPSGDPRRDGRIFGWASWIAGQCALALDRLIEARYFAQLAVNESSHAKEPRLINAAGALRTELIRWTAPL